MRRFQKLQFPSEGLDEKAFRSFDFADVQCSIRRDLHAPNLRLLVDGYRDAVFKKLNVGTRVGLALYAIKNGLVQL